MDELLLEGDHGGRTAFYYRVTGVEGEPVLGGEEAEGQDETNQHHPMWASPKDLELMGLLPEGLTGLVAGWLWPFRVRAVASPEDWEVVEHLWQPYSHDLSEFRGSTPGPDGMFKRGHLDFFRPDDPNAVVYLAELGDRPIGFALVRGLTTDCRQMGEFFVARAARGTGHARTFAEAVVRAHPGRWEIAFQEDNTRAARFWRRLGADVLSRRGRGAAARPWQAAHPAGRVAQRERGRVTIALPPDVLAMRDRGDDWAAWVDRLPALARDLLDEWELTVDGALMNGFCSLVVPVLTADGQRSVLKLHTDADADESDFEHLALQHWHGNGTVLLLRADPRRRAMLLERLHPRDLATIGDLEACEVVAGLYGRIHVPALPQLRTVTSYVERWTADLEALPRDAPIPRRMREQCVSLARDLVADPAFGRQ